MCILNTANMHLGEWFLFTIEPHLMGNSLEKEKEEEFLANICQGGRVTIPLSYRESLRLEKGTRVRIRIRKDEA